jgi:hypothetical protein
VTASLQAVFDRGPQLGTDGPGGEAIAAAREELDRVAEAHGLPTLASFGDLRPVPEDFDGPPEDLDEQLGPCTDWHDPRAGAELLRALAGLLTRGAGAFLPVDRGRLRAELGGLAGRLDAAAARSARFRLELA